MTPNNEDVSILGLTEGILEKAKEITKYLQAQNEAAPTFSCPSASVPVTTNYNDIQISLKESLEDLRCLVEGPAKFYRHYLMHGYELAAFQVALDFDFFTLVPSTSEISLDKLDRKSGLDVDRTNRIMRLLIMHRFFKEITPGFVSHNSFSLALQDEEFSSVVPGLESSPPGTPLLINDIILPEPGTVSRIWEREIRQADMVMLVSYGAKQRTRAEFESLLKEADKRYEIRKVHDSGTLGVLKVYLRH